MSNELYVYTLKASDVRVVVYPVNTEAKRWRAMINGQIVHEDGYASPADAMMAAWSSPLMSEHDGTFHLGDWSKNEMSRMRYPQEGE